MKKKFKFFTNISLFFNKIKKPFIIIFVLLFLNIGSKYPAISNENNISDIVAQEFYYKTEYEKYYKLYNDMYQQNLIQQIEFESEVIIPSYFDFKYTEYAYNLSLELNIPVRTIFRLIQQESSFIDTVTSVAGARGVMQLMPDTRDMYYKEFRVDTLQLDKVQEDIYIALMYINFLQNMWKDRGNSDKSLLRLSIASYNAGYGNVIKHKGVPPFKETQNFVSFILQPHSNPKFYSRVSKKNINNNFTDKPIT